MLHFVTKIMVFQNVKLFIVEIKYGKIKIVSKIFLNFFMIYYQNNLLYD